MVKVAGLKVWKSIKKRLKHRYFPVNFTHFFQSPYLQNTFGWLFLLISAFQPRFYHTLWSHFFRLFPHVFSFIIDIVGKGIPAPPPLFKATTPWPSLTSFLKPLFAFPSFLFHPLLSYFWLFPPPSPNLLLS